MSANPFRDPRSRPVLLVGFAAFFLLGAMQALYGPSFPLFRERFGLEIDQVSAVVSAQFFGAFISVTLSGMLLRLLRYRRLLAVGAGGVLLGMLGVAAAQLWWLVLLGAFVGGLGFGLLNVSFNLLLALVYRPNAAPALNLLNATFGVGAVVGPLLVAAFEPRLGAPFLALAGVAALLLALVLRLEAPAPTAPAPDAAPTAWGKVAGFVLLFFLYVSSEGGVAAWETEYLTPAFGAAAAASFTALFWGAITVGRFLATPLSALVRPPALVLGATALALVFMLLAHHLPAAPYLYAVVGLCLAPIFGTSLAWLTESFPERAEQVTPIVVASANLGPVFTAPLIGVAVAAGGTRVIPTALAALTLLLLLTVTGLFRRTRARA